MANLDDARATQLANIEKRTGKTLAELTKIVTSSGLAKHRERVAMLKSTLNIGHADANALVLYAVKADVPNVAANSAPAAPPSTPTAAASPEQILDGLYFGPKAALRAVHDKLLQAMYQFGDFGEAPKKTLCQL